ncbi:MAG: methionyl-tRNA formyltransferase, partial [Christensenellaceae bacterium]|nr:methionyl-tRNA formyltransferase [Christensenellaceae bacterium]
PEKISKNTTELANFSPDIIVTCAFGQILRQSVLDIAPVINVHGSLLPKYRGAAPIQWAVINGETETGITIAKTELGLDCGAIIEQRKTRIGEDETAGELQERLSLIGAELLIVALDKIEKNTAAYTPQNEDAVTNAPMLNKEMSHIDWGKSATEIVNLIRGLNPWPVAYFLLDETPVRVFRASVCRPLPFVVNTDENTTAGYVVHASGKFGLFVKCGADFLAVNELQFPNKKRMPATEYLNGKSIAVGTILG